MKNLAQLVILAVLVGAQVACEPSVEEQYIPPPKTVVANGPRARKALSCSLTPAQSIEALRHKLLEAASAEWGYATGSPNVIVAEIAQGSGVAYVSWVVLQKAGSGAWQTYGIPSPIVMDSGHKNVYIETKGRSHTFEVRMSKKRTIRLPLPE